MSDAEWERFKATFKQGGRPMPSIVKRAESDRRRLILGFVGIYAIVAVQLGFAIRALARARDLVGASEPVMTVLVTLAIVVIVHVSMRGGFRDDGSAPLALLEGLERRHAGRRRMMRWMPWLIGAGIAGTMGTMTATMIATGQFQPGPAATTAATCLASIALAWIMIRRVGTKIDRELREAHEARRLLTEDEAPR
ncbi:Hypothetical protein A7982_02601 [Minicystis rosea]|nr:Hypothetical protein A7982_02601 [Minicystis rosea]